MPAVQITAKQAGHMVLCTYIYHYYTQYNFLFPFLNLYTPFAYLYMCQFPPFFQIFATWTLNRRIPRTIPLVLTPHHQANLNISQLVQHSHQFQLSLWKKLSQVYSLRWETLIPTCLELDDTARLKPRRSVTNISKWLQAFTVYVSVIAKKQAHRVPVIMGYQILILESSNEYRNDCWLGYDRCFRQQATSQSNRKWSDMDSTLWNMAFTGQARTDQCFSLFHASKDCKLASDRGMNAEP